MTDELKEWFLMPSIKECLAEYEKQDIGLIADIAKHGCSGGVAGITYYSETIAFHDHHQEEIWQLPRKRAIVGWLFFVKPSLIMSPTAPVSIIWMPKEETSG